MPLTAPIRTPTRPVNPLAWQQLQDAYAACKGVGEGKKRHPWTPESCVLLGRLFLAAWGQMPRSSRLRPEYAMPPWRTIQRHWGTLAAYHQALAQCGCTSEGARCVEAYAFHAQWQKIDTKSLRCAGLLDAYQKHLREAYTWPGKARWRADRLEDAHG